MKTKKIKINGRSLQFYFWGKPKKPKLFLIHGWMDTGASFQFLAEYLKEDYHCISWDIRGYGHSEHTKSPLGYFFFEYIADLHQILQKLAPEEKVTLIGHSMGGAITTLYAGIFPENVERIVNIEGFTPIFNRHLHPADRVRLWLSELETKAFKIYPTLKEIASRLQKANPLLSSERAHFLAKHLTKKVKGGWKIATDPLHKVTDPYALGADASYPFWERIQCPGLFLLAEHTQKIEAAAQGETLRLVKEREKHMPASCRMKLIPGTSHMIHHEKPEELAEEIKSFLEETKSLRA